MAEIKMYKTPVCPFCQRAIKLLEQKGVEPQAIEQIDISQEPHKRETMLSESGGRKTVPQIFIDGQHIGGFDELQALDKEGQLDQLLAA